jgi:hypothetical protein
MSMMIRVKFIYEETLPGLLAYCRRNVKATQINPGSSTISCEGVERSMSLLSRVVDPRQHPVEPRRGGIQVREIQPAASLTPATSPFSIALFRSDLAPHRTTLEMDRGRMADPVEDRRFDG